MPYMAKNDKLLYVTQLLSLRESTPCTPELLHPPDLPKSDIRLHQSEK